MNNDWFEDDFKTDYPLEDLYSDGFEGNYPDIDVIEINEDDDEIVEDLKLFFINNDIFDDEIIKESCDEFCEVKKRVNFINQKYKDNDFFRVNNLKPLKRRYLSNILNYEKSTPQYLLADFILTNLLEIDSYIYEHEIKELNVKRKNL